MKQIAIKFKNIIERIDMFSFYPILYKFRMGKNEKKMFDKYIKKAHCYLEFGSGGSTIRALKKSKAKIYSVESSVDWVKYLRKYRIINSAFNNNKIFFHTVNIGNTRKYGFPISKNLKDLFPNYSSSIFRSYDLSQVDLILIDGRFRVACTLNVILNIPIENPIILFHDFWNREHYHVVLNYLILLERVDDIAVFKIKENVDFNSVKQNYEIYKYIPL